MISLNMYRQGNRLVPASRMDEEDMAQLQEGKIYDVVCSRPTASNKMRRLFHGAIAHFAEATGQSRETLEFNLKVAIGWADLVPLWGGRVIPHPRSTRGRALTPALVDRALDVLIETYAPHLSRDELIAELKRKTNYERI